MLYNGKSNIKKVIKKKAFDAKENNLEAIKNQLNINSPINFKNSNFRRKKVLTVVSGSLSIMFGVLFSVKMTAIKNMYKPSYTTAAVFINQSKKAQDITIAVGLVSLSILFFIIFIIRLYRHFHRK